MAGFYNLDHKEVIRIKVKKCDGKMQPEYKKFSIDPQITSFEMLQGILARAFEIRSDFTISYLATDTEGQSVYLSMLSDWDMDAAFQCAADPCLKLKVDLRPFEEEMEDWDVIAPAEIPNHKISSLLDKNSFLFSITGSISQNIGRTVNSMQKAMGLKQSEGETIKPLKPPMSDMEFHNYLDSAGFMVKPNEFRLSIYQGGIEPSLRRVAWRHLLNIYPANMSGRDRFDYMKRKEEEYRRLREQWRERFRNNTATEEVKYVAAMVKKDVLRTDRTHGFYAGTDENENTLSLFHILVTYALTHPDVSYCQGMSDLASPLLVTQKDEGQAYVCFCALMRRLRENFSLDGHAIMTKFSHLSMLLAMYDPALHSYLQEQSAGDMFFCYRWFLLELKREFPFSDALYVLEVMWATLPPDPPDGDLPLVDADYSSRLLSSSPCSPTLTFQHAMYAKLLAMRRVGALASHQHNRAATAVKATKPSPDAGDSAKKPTCSLSLTTCSTSLPNGGGDVSTVSLFNSSPVGDVEDCTSDFPEVDNPLTRSMQRKSESIDQVLTEGERDRDNEESIEEVGAAGSSACEASDVSQTKDLNNVEEECGEISAQDENVVEDIRVVANHFGSYPGDKSSQSVDIGGSHSLDVGYASKKDEDESRAAQFSLSVSSSEVEYADSGVTSEVSESSEHHTQFNLSLDSTTHNSTRDDSEAGYTRTHSASANSHLDSSNSACASDVSDPPTNTDSSSQSGIFQSMKRLLTSPKRRPGNTSALTDGKPVSPQHAAASRESSGSSEESVSQSSVSECQAATESLENSSSQEKPIVQNPSSLPPPQEFGCGNPFLMFASLTLLLQHRDAVLGGSYCYEEIAMHFDRLVRRHNAARMLQHARQMYTNYLRAQQARVDRMVDEAVEKAELGLSC